MTSVLTLPPVSIVFISSHGSRGKNKVFLTGITVLTLMSSLQIPDSLTQNSLLNLTVRGYKGNSVIFTNTTTLTFSPKNVSTVIQTDRSHYHPGDAVKVRAMCVQLDNHPYKDRVDLSVRVRLYCLCERTKPQELCSFFIAHWDLD